MTTWLCLIVLSASFLASVRTSDDVTFHDSELTWEEARAACRADGKQLWAPESRAEMAAVIEQNGHDNSEVWLGWNDHDAEGTWMDGSGNILPNGLDSDLWLNNEPNNYGSGEHCAHYNWASSKLMNDLFCDNKKIYACQPRKPRECECQDYNWKCNAAQRWGSDPDKYCQVANVLKRCPRLCGLCGADN